MGKTKEPVRQKVLVAVECDKDRLYSTLPVAIIYLREIHAKYPNTDITLEEHWTGYEDMEMRFSYSRLETDDEFASRIETERAEAKLAQDRYDAEVRRGAKLKQLEALKRELGLR